MLAERTPFFLKMTRLATKKVSGFSGKQKGQGYYGKARKPNISRASY